MKVISLLGPTKNDGNGNLSGHVRVYEYDAGTTTWVQLGQDIDGEAADDGSGVSVAINGNTNVLKYVAIGATGNDGNGNLSGHVRVYEYDAGTTTWVKFGQDIDGEAADDGCGISVSLSEGGTIVAVGATGNDGNGANSGHVRVFGFDHLLNLGVK